MKDVISELAKLKFFKMENKGKQGSRRSSRTEEYRWFAMENEGDGNCNPIAQFNDEEDCNLFLQAKREAFVVQQQPTKSSRKQQNDNDSVDLSIVTDD